MISTFEVFNKLGFLSSRCFLKNDDKSIILGILFDRSSIKLLPLGQLMKISKQILLQVDLIFILF